MKTIVPPIMPPREVVARTLWGEARGEGRDGMIAVACVIRNRFTHPRWWGATPTAVCLKPWQFSCWLEGDPNRSKMLAVTEGDRAFRFALEIADLLLAGKLADVTNAADHYHAEGVSPVWASGQQAVARIGKHVFYRLELKPPA